MQRQGSPWTAGGTLPSGKTETGDWAQYGITSGPGEAKVEAISFPIPLEVAPENHEFVSLATKESAHCPGGVAKPQAEPGYLCLFEGTTTLKKPGLVFAYVMNPAGGPLEAGTTGAVLVFLTEELPPVKAGQEVSSEGAWAVTAK